MEKELESDINQVKKQCEVNNKFLKELIEGKYSSWNNYLQGELRFGIARRWNSCFPSYFNIKGGCYVLIPGDYKYTNIYDNEKNKEEIKIGVIVIDPGFAFIDTLRETYQIEPQDISSIIVTHFHPHHMISLLEYATIMKTSKQHCNIFINEVVFDTYKSLQSDNINIKPLRNGILYEIMSYSTIYNDYIKISVKTVDIDQGRLRNINGSQGLILEITRLDVKDDRAKKISDYRIGILGNIDDKNDNIDNYVHCFKDVDILLFHFGVFSNKDSWMDCKYLSMDYVKQILEKILSEPEVKRKIIVLSEFGLELADDNTLYRNLQPFIESYFWRLPIIFAQLYLKEKSDIYEEKKIKECLHLFARATLSIIDRINKPTTTMIDLSNQGLTKKQIEELLVAITYQVLVICNNSEFKLKIKKLYNKIKNYIENIKKNEIRNELNLHEYLNFLNKNCTDFNELEDVYKKLIERADFETNPMPIKHLIVSCNLLIENIARNLENIGNVLYYIDKLTYIPKYSESRGVHKHHWIYGENQGITNLNLFWTICLIGVFLLRKELGKYQPKSNYESKDIPLIQIRNIFQKDIESSANLIVGDIGCTFGIDPLEPNHNGRKMGIKLKSSDGNWISPLMTKCIYNNENDKIEYYE